MSRLRNQNWYNLQETRRYPLVDTADGVVADGRLPTDILVDCHLRWQMDVCQFAYIGGVTVTDKLVSLVIMGVDDPANPSVRIPLAAVSLLQPVGRYAYHAVTPLSPDVGGFVVFGDTTEPVAVKFSDPQQTLLLSRCARPYRALPVPTLRKQNRVDGLAGLVNLLPGTDMISAVETIQVYAQDRTALVFRLAKPTAVRNTLAEYIGPCQKRPESRNCDKEGVETINGVQPDCNGDIQILFRNLDVGNYCDSEAAGQTLDQALGIDDVCTTTQLYKQIERFAGTDSCDSESEPVSASSVSLSLSSSPSESYASGSSDSSDSDGGNGDGWSQLTLPYTTRFDAASSPLTVKRGIFELLQGTESPDEPQLGSDPDVSQSLYAHDRSQTNIAVLAAHGLGDAVDKHVETHVSIPAVANQQANAGLLLNYRVVNPQTGPHLEYFVVQLNRTIGQFRILRFSGSSFISESHVLLSSPVVPGHWYSIAVDIVQFSANQVAVSALVAGVTDPGWPGVTMSVALNSYLPADGQFGLFTDRSDAMFSFLQLEAASG